MSLLQSVSEHWYAKLLHPPLSYHVTFCYLLIFYLRLEENSASRSSIPASDCRADRFLTNSDLSCSARVRKILQSRKRVTHVYCVQSGRYAPLGQWLKDCSRVLPSILDHCQKETSLFDASPKVHQDAASVCQLHLQGSSVVGRFISPTVCNHTFHLRLCQHLSLVREPLSAWDLHWVLAKVMEPHL